MARKSKGTLSLRDGIWQLEYFTNGKRVKQSLHTKNEDEAKRERDKIMHPLVLRDKEDKLIQLRHALEDVKETQERIIAESKEYLPISETWAAYIANPTRPDAGAGTLRQYSFQFKAFTNWMTAEHKQIVYLKDVTEQMTEEYASYLKPLVSANTYNKHVGLLRLIYRVLGKSQGIKVNPFGEIKKLKEVQQHRFELPMAKVFEIIQAAEGELKTLLMLGVYTGQRLGDCCTYTWSKVDIRQGFIVSSQRKTESHGGKPLHIPIHPSLRGELEQTPLKKRKGYIIPKMAELYLRNNDKVTDQIQRLFKEYGVEIHAPGTGGDSYKRAVIQYGFHSLRHTFVSIMAEAGIPQAVVQAIVGHATVAMAQHYTHIGDKAIVQAVNAIPAIDGTQDEAVNIREIIYESLCSANLSKLQEIASILGCHIK